MIVFFSHSKVNIFFQSSKLFQNKKALIINSYRKFSPKNDKKKRSFSVVKIHDVAIVNYFSRNE